MWSTEDLQVRHKAVDLSVAVYNRIGRSPHIQKNFWLRDQIQRSAVSIPSNIAEWNDRGTDKEFVRFLYIARGSASELSTQLLIASKVWYIGVDEYTALSETCRSIQKMLNWLIKSLS